MSQGAGHKASYFNERIGRHPERSEGSGREASPHPRFFVGFSASSE